MIDFKLLFKHLLRYKWLIILAPIIGVATTYYFVRELPDSYRSTAQVSVLSSMSTTPNMRGFQLTSYIVELAKSKRMVNTLGYHLILHDLESEQGSFKEWSEEVKSLSNVQRLEAIEAFRERLERQAILSVADDTSSVKLFSIVRSMGYNQTELQDDLKISKNDVTGVVDVAFTSENPDLSVYAVNTLSSNLIVSFNAITAVNQDRSMALMDSLLQDKYQVMNERKDMLNRYKAGTGVLRSGSQTQALYSRVSSYEQRRVDAFREIETLKGAIQSIDERLYNSAEQQNLGVSADVLLLDEQLKLANQRYVDGGFKAADRQHVDSLQRIRAVKMLTATDDVLGVNSRQTRQALISKRRSFETDLAVAQSGVESIERELAELQRRFNAMMPTDAQLENLEQEYAIANKEYLDALGKYNTASMNNASGLRLSIMEYGLPGLPQISKKIIYLGASGAGSVALCVSVLVLLCFIDRRVTQRMQLQYVTKGAVLGELNAIHYKNLDIGKVWRNEEERADFTTFKNHLRALRFDVGKQLSANDDKVLMVTSLSTGEGKTLLSSSLAYAFAMTGKRVLLMSNTESVALPIELTAEKAIPQNFDTFLKDQQIEPEELITWLQIKAGDQSLLEVTDLKTLERAFAVLKKEFDLIVIDATEMHQVNQFREWLSLSDRTLAVFKHGETVEQEDALVIQEMQEQSQFLGWVLNGVK